ncbi:type ISP restriction/modification enzyme [Clavibacter sp. Sh2141]|uniref:type ISP restriction/modification enzyme n=1 Tax=Clavibacter sp. Sh2141 TaxID=3395374 RepID=UPI0039BCCDE0
MHQTGAGTGETSYYPAINRLLSGLGALGGRKRAALSAPRGINGSFPDVAIYDVRANVIVLPVEVKGKDADIQRLAKSSQAKRYALNFGGGTVLVTNLVSFAVSEIDQSSGRLVVRSTVHLTTPTAGDDFAMRENAGTELTGLIDAASAVRATITDANYVARLLAYHGEQMMQRIKTAGKPQQILAPFRSSFANGLSMELDDEMLVPTTVQTVIYGLFAAWMEEEDPQDFDWLTAAYRLRLPVYGELIHTILSPTIVRLCNLPPLLEDAARMLSWVDREAFISAFDGGAIEYFYEPFLAAFDAHLRKELGVWYTPEAVANYQVARVDHHLRNELGVAEGLADSTELFVLDPACGTGTYLTSVLRHIRQYYLDLGEPEAVAAQRAAEAARTRVIGFEILPAAFVIAHINVSHLLASWGAPFEEGQRARIYLTNSLTGWKNGAEEQPLAIEALADEIAAAAKVKNDEPVIAIIGNPPYEGFSAAVSQEEIDLLRPWVEPLLSEFGMRKSRLGDLYIRFWRMAVHKITDLSGRGVVSFISNRRWLSGRSYPVMRRSISADFDLVIVDDLHGDLHERLANDGSVFSTDIATGIKVGTAIVTAIRTNADVPHAVLHRDIYGSSSEKRSQLSRISEDLALADADAERLTIGVGNRWRFATPVVTDAPLLSDYFTGTFSGVQPVREEGVMDRSRATLASRMSDYYDFDGTDVRDLTAAHAGFGVSRVDYDAARVRKKLAELGAAFDDSRIVDFEYRPFSRRYLYWETRSRLLHRARKDLFNNWHGVTGQVAIACAQTARRPGGARPVLTNAVPSYHVTDPDARVFTRFRDYGEGAGGDDSGTLAIPGTAREFRSSIAPDWIAAGRSAGLEGTDDDIGDVIFYALSSVMMSPAWLASQPAEQDDFPSVPLPATAEGLLMASELGKRYAELSDVRTPVIGVTSGSIPSDLATVGLQSSSSAVTLTYGRIKEHGGLYDAETNTIWWNRDKTGGWTGVSPEVWRYSSGGFSVLSKHLSYFVGVPISQAEVEEVRLLCRRLQAIVNMAEPLDAVFSLAIESPLEFAVSVPSGSSGTVADA